MAESAERSIELLFAPYFGPQQARRTTLSELDVRQLSDGLRRIGKDSWSKVPRLYAVLRMINQVQVIDSFITQGVSDIWFPFSHKSLPDTLRSPSSRFEFLEAQNLVLTKAFDLEREDGKHRHFSKAEDIPLKKIEELGKGGFGYVDRVISTITYKEYARKLIPRGRTFKKDMQVLKDFERELGHLKKLSHIHIVELVGSYTDPKFVGIIMSPVAEYNLKDFLSLDPLPSGDRSFLRTFFGCLAAALCYLHENQIRHKDIKPQNILVKGHQIFLTDFGLSLDWSELGQSTTSGPTIKTPRYCAPEVADLMPRNSFSDIWSLGCVFLEIWTALKGEKVASLFEHLEGHGSKSTCYYLNYSAIIAWQRNLEERPGTPEDNSPSAWISRMMQFDQDKRWTAHTVFDRISEANANPHNRFAFSGLCCVGDEDSTDSAHSSKRISANLDETGASSIATYFPRTVAAEDSVEVGSSATNLRQTIRPLKIPISSRDRPKDGPRDVPRSVSDSTGAFGMPPAVPSTLHQQVTRPSIGGSMTSTRGPSGTRSDIRLPSRGSYGQPVAPPVAATNVQGRVTQPTNGRGYSISGPTPQQAPQSIRQPMTQPLRAKYNETPAAPPAPPVKIHHRRTNTLSGLGERLFGTSGSVMYAAEDPQRPSIDSIRSFSFGLEKKKSVDLESQQEEKSDRRFSLLPTSMSLKGMMGGPKDQDDPNSPVPLPDDFPQPPTSRGPSRPVTSQHPPMNSYDPPQGVYQGNEGQQKQQRRVKVINPLRPQQQYQQHQKTPSQTPNDVYGGTGVYAPTSQYGQHQERSYLSGPTPPVESEAQRPNQGQLQYPEGYNDYDRPHPSMQQGRQGKGPPVLLKPNRKFADAYNNEQGPTHHEGSSGPAKKVIDFFRRRGRARVDDYR
jgi:serine/threonine protein kinase